MFLFTLFGGFNFEWFHLQVRSVRGHVSHRNDGPENGRWDDREPSEPENSSFWASGEGTASLYWFIIVKNNKKTLGSIILNLERLCAVSICNNLSNLILILNLIQDGAIRVQDLSLPELIGIVDTCFCCLVRKRHESCVSQSTNGLVLDLRFHVKSTVCLSVDHLVGRSFAGTDRLHVSVCS